MPDAPQKRTRDLGVALDYAEPFTFIAIITAAGAACLFVVRLVTRRSLRPPPLGWTVAIGLRKTTLFNSLAMLALSVGGAGKVSVLAYTMPFCPPRLRTTPGRAP